MIVGGRFWSSMSLHSKPTKGVECLPSNMKLDDGWWAMESTSSTAMGRGQEYYKRSAHTEILQMPSICFKEDCVKGARVSRGYAGVIQGLQICRFYHGGVLALKKLLVYLQIDMFGVVPSLIPTYVEDTLFHGVYDKKNKSYTWLVG